jgi:3'(2'), 5'-bisphosphate nucleotidase
MTQNELLQFAIDSAILASGEILDVYRQEFSVEFKDDKSPLTLADRRAHKAICAALEPTGLPILSEEGKNIPYEERKDWERFWLVDPLDGTKEFVKRNGEFTVNIALIEQNKPVMGVILVPVTGLLYFASKSAGAFKITLGEDVNTDLASLVSHGERIPGHKDNKRLTVVGSRSHLSPETQEFIDNLAKDNPEMEFVSIGSSLKLCLVAEGAADIYPRFGPTMEWDTAAGHAIAWISGATIVIAESGQPMQYNKPNLLNPYFIARRA